MGDVILLKPREKVQQNEEIDLEKSNKAFLEAKNLKIKQFRDRENAKIANPLKKGKRTV